MVNYQVAPTQNLRGEIQVPGDKSISHRALMLSAIAEGRTQIDGFLMGADNLATMTAFQQMGVDIQVKNDNQLMVQGVGLNGLQAPADVLDLGNSGTAIRLLAGLLAGQWFDAVLTGDESLCRRPMGRVVEPLRRMGAKISMSEYGTPPLKISGRQSLTGIEYVLPIASAQVKSCLLLAGLYAQGETCVVESKPSRDHTERMLKLFHYSVHQENKRICLSGGGRLIAADIIVPGDISSAAFFIVAATITPGANILLRQTGLNPTRTGIINLLRMMGADIRVENLHEKSGEPFGDVRVRYAKLHGIEIPEEQVSLAIDEFPVLFIAAVMAEGKTILRGAAELRVKESDRIFAMAQGLKTLGIKTTVLSDGIIIYPGVFRGGEIDSFGDHRVAMAFAVAGNVAQSLVTIHHCDNVQTSFPNFLLLAQEIGMNIMMMQDDCRNF